VNTQRKKWHTFSLAEKQDTIIVFIFFQVIHILLA